MTPNSEHQSPDSVATRGMDTIGRAKMDLERGDYAKARQRLESYLQHRGYDPSLLAWIGRIAYDMHDLHTAGRLWLLSAEQGEKVDRTIELFLQSTADNPRQALMQLPRPVRLASIDRYPPLVQERLRRLGLADALPEVYEANPGKPTHERTLADRMIPLLIISVVILFIGSCTLGACTALQWIVGSEG